MANLAALLSRRGATRRRSSDARCHAARRASASTTPTSCRREQPAPLKKAGRLGEAEPLLRLAYEGRLARGGAEHPDTVTAYGNLQACLAKLKRKRKR